MKHRTMAGVFCQIIDIFLRFSNEKIVPTHSFFIFKRAGLYKFLVWGYGIFVQHFYDP